METFQDPAIRTSRDAPASSSSADTRARPEPPPAPQGAEHSPGRLDSLIKDLSTPFPCQQLVDIILQAVLNYNTIVENTPCQAWRWYKSPSLPGSQTATLVYTNEVFSLYFQS